MPKNIKYKFIDEIENDDWLPTLTCPTSEKPDFHQQNNSPVTSDEMPLVQYSDSESDSESRSSLQLAKGILSRVAFPTRHFSKWKKYRLIQDLMQKFSSMGSLPPKIETPDPADKITLSWNILVEALVNPDKKKNADEQYRAIILALRETVSLLLSAEERVKKQFEHQLKFIKQLSYFRFAGVGLFNYCSELVELVTDRDLPTDLTLANFLQELKSRTQQMNKHPGQRLLQDDHEEPKPHKEEEFRQTSTLQPWAYGVSLKPHPPGKAQPEQIVETARRSRLAAQKRHNDKGNRSNQCDPDSLVQKPGRRCMFARHDD